MQKLLPLCTYFWLTSTAFCLGQVVLNNITHAGYSSDYAGEGKKQPGTEVIASTAGGGVTFTAGSSYEHTGQFYVASDGIWDATGDGTNTGIDIFGYAPKGIGSYLPYQGIGIKGASLSKVGAGQPRFGQLQLNSTGEFPALGGLYISSTLAFDGSGPQTGSVITTPLATSPQADEVVIFAPTATVTGASHINYINGYARVIDPTGPFTLPIGYPTMEGFSLHALTINRSVRGSVTSRYLPSLQHPAANRGDSIVSVHSASNWQIDAPASTGLTVTLVDTLLADEDAQSIRLVGWNGKAWVNLSTGATEVVRTEHGYQVSGRLSGHITDLAIGFVSTRPREQSSPLTVWPNPTRQKLSISLPADQLVQRVSVLDLKGRLLFTNSGQDSTIDVSALPTGNYLVEVHTANKQVVRQRFVKH